MRKELEAKSYRKIQIGECEYVGRDGWKNRLPDYIVKDFPDRYFLNKRVLDLGCASGAILFLLAQKGIKWGVGVEVDDRKLKIGLEVKKNHGFDQILFLNIDILSYFKDNLEHFDCIFVLNILHHFPDPLTVLNFIIGLSDDMVCMELPNKAWYKAYHQDKEKKVHFRHALGPEDIINYMAKVDFSCMSVRDSENQESFRGGGRKVYLFKKNAVKEISVSEVDTRRRQLVVGPGASGKTTLCVSLGLVKEGESRREFKFRDKYSYSRSLFQRLVKKIPTSNRSNSYQQFSSDKTILYLKPNYQTKTNSRMIRGLELNIKAWVDAMHREKYSAIVCYAPKYILKHRLLNRLYSRFLVDLDSRTIDCLVDSVLDHNLEERQVEKLIRDRLIDQGYGEAEKQAFQNKTVKQVLREFVYPNFMFSYQKLFALLKRESIDFSVIKTFNVEKLEK